jgi:sugar lactone lactonase YvrE
MLVLAGAMACSPQSSSPSPAAPVQPARTDGAVSPPPAAHETPPAAAPPPGMADAMPAPARDGDGSTGTVTPHAPDAAAGPEAGRGADLASEASPPAPPLGDFPLTGLQAAKPELFAATTARVEGPSWRAGEVFFAADGLGLMRADDQGHVFRYQPTLNPVGSFTLGDGSLLVCEKKHVLLQIFADGKIGVLVGEGGAAAFCNDITVDGAGNVFFSDSRAGAIMKLTPAGDLTKWVTGRKYPNGLEVDRKNEFLYFSDTGVNTLFRVPMTAGGTAGAVESLGPMIADGMAIDAWGNLWLAQVTAGQAMVYDPNKRQIIARVNAGGPQSTNLTFGGANNDTLFTSVAGKGIMRIAVGVRGFSHPGAAHYAVKAMLDLPPANTPAN